MESLDRGQFLEPVSENKGARYHDEGIKKNLPYIQQEELL
jgi:uncharacterized protein (DUF2164 family)